MEQMTFLPKLMLHKQPVKSQHYSELQLAFHSCLGIEMAVP